MMSCNLIVESRGTGEDFALPISLPDQNQAQTSKQQAYGDGYRQGMIFDDARLILQGLATPDTKAACLPEVSLDKF